MLRKSGATPRPRRDGGQRDSSIGRKRQTAGQVDLGMQVKYILKTDEFSSEGIKINAVASSRRHGFRCELVGLVRLESQKDVAGKSPAACHR